MTNYNLDELIEQEGMAGFAREYEHLQAVFTITETVKHLSKDMKDFAIQYFDYRKQNVLSLLNLTSPFEDVQQRFPKEAAKDKFRRKQHFFDALEQANLQFKEAVNYNNKVFQRDKAFLHLTALDYVFDLIAYDQLERLFAQNQTEDFTKTIIAAYRDIVQETVKDNKKMCLQTRFLVDLVNSSQYYPTAERLVRKIAEEGLDRQSVEGKYVAGLSGAILRTKAQPALLAWESGKDFGGKVWKDVGLISSNVLFCLGTFAAEPLIAGTILIAYIGKSVWDTPFALSYAEGGALVAGTYLSIKMGKGYTDFIDKVKDNVHHSYMARNKPLLDRIVKERELVFHPLPVSTQPY